MSLTTFTIDGNTYQSYASVAEADAYLLADPTRAAAWAAITDDQKELNLIAATRRIDLLDFKGEKTSDTQTTEWPRTGVVCDGVAVDDSTIPQQVEDATALVAGSITLDPSQSTAGTSGSNIKRAKAGSAEVEFFRPVVTSGGGALQDTHALSLLQCLLGGGVADSAAGFGLASGTDGESSFSDGDYPGLPEGYP